MIVLCPDCQTSVPLRPEDPWLRCPGCGLEADLSHLETSPGAAALPLVEDLAGQTLGPYRLEARLGVGGMGVVYRAHRVSPVEGTAGEGSPGPAAGDGGVAVKVLHGDYHFRQPSFLARFQREVRALAQLDHPHIVRLLDSGRDGDRHYLVTELVEGESLAQLLRGGPLPPGRAAALCAQVADALAYAHDQGVIHRDVKPANILVAGDQVKVVDFGLARITGWDGPVTSLTRTNLAMGTYNYLAPEQRVSAKEVDGRADLFSLGVVCYEALTGELPLGAFAPPSRLRSAVPRRADRLVRRALAVDPADRHPDAASLAAELRLLAPPPRAWSRRVQGVAAALVVLGAGTAPAWWALSAGAPPPRAALAHLGAVASNRDAAKEAETRPGVVPLDPYAFFASQGIGAPTPPRGALANGDVEDQALFRQWSAAWAAHQALTAPLPRPPAPFDPYAFFASQGKGGIRPSPPPRYLLKGDVEDQALHQRWAAAWNAHQALTAPLPAPAVAFDAPRTKGDPLVDELPTKGRKRRKTPSVAARRRVVEPEEETLTLLSRAVRAGMPLKGNPGRPPGKLVKAQPDLYVFWNARYRAHQASLDHKSPRGYPVAAPRPGPRRVVPRPPARPAPRRRPMVAPEKPIK